MKMLIRYITTILFFALCYQKAYATCLPGETDPQLCETREILYTTDEASVLQEKAIALGTPARIYEYLRNNAEYVPYHGARSNSLNTFLSLRGNDVDLASALIAMLRSVGIKARYATADIRIKKSQLANWLGGIINEDLAVSILTNQGIQNVDATDPELVEFQHVWVEALIDTANYRGGGPNNTAVCTIEGGTCHWLPLDPSFKERVYKGTHTLLLRDLNFDYNSYYNAQTNPGKKNKNPLEIFEEQALAYLQTNHPGITLKDVVDKGEIINDRSSLLPASLPYEVVGSLAHYNSIEDYDAANSIIWTKYLRSKIVLSECPDVPLPTTFNINVAELSTKRLTITIFDNGGSLVFGHRLDGQASGGSLIMEEGASLIVSCNGANTAVGPGLPVNVELEIDIEPGEQPIEVTYENLIIGGYYLIATGGETSNWSQVKRASQQLLQANEDYAIVVDNIGAIGAPGIPYVDENSSGAADAGDTALINHLPAQDALTGGLLYVAQSLYYTRLREEAERYSRLKGIISPVSAYLGIVSTTDEVEYLDNVPFAVTPGGLLIDLKGIRINGSWEIDQTETYSNETFKFIGHLGSSLEHEVWQEITGYDAISTVRGIQFANEQGKTLRDINSIANTFPTEVYNLGFSNSAPSGFNRFDWSLFGRNLITWDYTGSDPNAAFNAFRPDITGMNLTDPQTALLTYTANNAASFHLNMEALDNLENNLLALIPTENDLNSATFTHADSANYPTLDIITTSTTASGFSVSSSRINSTSYSFTANETQQKADGTYTIPVNVRLAPKNNQFVRAVDFGANTSSWYLQDVTIESSNGNFSIVDYSKSGSIVTVTLKPTGSNSNGLKNVELWYWFAETSVPPAFTHTGIEIYSNKYVTYNGPWLDLSFTINDELSITCNGVTTEALPSILLSAAETCFNDVLITPNQAFTDFIDKDLGFNPSTYAFRSTLLNIDEYDINFIFNTVRNDLYLNPGASIQYLMPERLPDDFNYVFSTYLRNVFNTDDDLVQSTYAIANFSDRLVAGGGYVTAEETIKPEESTDFNNEIFTDLNLVAISNNDLIITPSTADPVSTVTGNMYHDETDITIKGRGLHYSLTRTYNSDNSDKDSPFSFGWSHSYGMKLVSNDYGKFPNYPAAQAPENGNNMTSSITYTDERGGDSNYLVDDLGAFSVTSPIGKFDTLELDMDVSTPTPGFYTLTFRNGTKYIFDAQGEDLKVPGKTARLARIEDPYGNIFTFSYDGSGRLTNVVDNLGISGRTGITFTYTNADAHVDSVSDWSGRTWQFGYDAQDRLTSITDPLNQIKNYTYHGDSALLNELIHPQDRGGVKKTMTFSYYENGQSYDQKDKLGNTESLIYDLFRKRTRVTNPRGFVREYNYDENGALTKLREPDGAILQFQNNQDVLRYSKTDGLGFETLYSYRQDRAINNLASDTGGNVTLEQDPLGNTTEFDYGIYDQPTRIADKNDNEQFMTYYPTTDVGTGAVEGKLQKIEATLNSTLTLLEEYTYFADGNLKQKIEYIDPADSNRKRITDYLYAENGLNLDSMTISGATSGIPVTTTYTYDSLGRKETETVQRRTSATDATMIDLVTTTEYDNLGRVIKVTNPRGDIAETVYDENGQTKEEKIHHKLAGGGFDVRTYAVHEYDAADRRIKTTDIDGNITTFAYDEMGNLISTTDANGHTSRIEYDSMNRQTAVIDANGHRVESEYDLNGRLTKIIDANGNNTTFEYDSLDRQTKIITTLGFETQTIYDSNGNQTHITDANGVAGTQPKNSQGATVYNEYDEFNRLTRSVNAEEGQTLTSYDLLSNITSITDAEGRVTQMRYDDMGRLAEVIDPLVETPTDKTIIFTYDEVGNLLTQTDRNGEVTRFNYDNLNRLTLTEFLADNTTEIQTYDDHNNLQALTNADVTYTYEYDTKNRLTKKTDSRTGKSLEWEYDGVNNPVKKTDYQGDIIEYQYDSTNRLVSLSSTAYLQVSYHYDPAGRLLNRILSNGARTNYSYDNDNRLTSLTNVSANGTVVHSQTYQYDNIGNIIQTTNGSGNTVFTLDPTYRLLNADSPGTANDHSYTYDFVGNRRSHTSSAGTQAYLYNQGNRLTEIRDGSDAGPLVYSFEYDDNGSRTKKWQGTVNTGLLLQDYRYDQKRRIEQIVTSSQVNHFKYDVNNYRISKQDSSGPNEYLLEAEHLEATYGAFDKIKAKYLRGVIVDEIVNGYEYDGDGNDTNITFHHDHLRSVTALTGHAGTTEETIQYDPFGAVQSQTGTSNNKLRYTGREEDSDTGLYYYRARYYDPEVGRFISEDPLGFKAGINFYAYVGNNPINARDPSGLETVFVGGAGVNGDYIPSMVSALQNAGITDARAIDRSSASFGNELIDAASIPFINQYHGDDRYDRYDGRVNIPLAQGEQLNLIGYSFGAVQTPQTALAIARGGQTVDNLVLIGSPINQSLLSAVQNEPNISNVHVINIEGDPIRAGMSDWDIIRSVPTLIEQQQTGTGHFYYAPSGAEGDLRRQGLANDIADMFGVGSQAAGGFVLYPSKPNMNAAYRVYSK